MNDDSRDFWKKTAKDRLVVIWIQMALMFGAFLIIAINT